MTVKETINKRYSARYFDKSKEIKEEDLNVILEAGQKAPSGFGSEPWKFVLIKGKRNMIFEAMNEQQASIDASELIAFLYVKEAYIKNNPQFIDKYKQSGFDEDKVTMYRQRIEQIVVNRPNYFREQTFFAVSQMVLQATELGIDTLIMGGFKEALLLEKLGLDANLYGISVVVAFGYNTLHQPTRKTRSLEEICLEIDLK